MLVNLLLSILLFSLTLWLGLYLVQRRTPDRRLGWTGVGLAAYALGIATLVVFTHSALRADPLLPIQFWWLLSLPALFWTGAAIQLLPTTQRLRPHLERFWQYGQLPLIALLAPLFFAAGGNPARTPIWLLYALLTIAVLLPLGSVMILLLHSALTSQPRRLSALLLVAILLFTLSMVALFLPILPIAPQWIMLSMGIDLALLGFAIGKLDAFEQGEQFLPDLLLSLSTTTLAILLFGGLVAITMAVDTGITPAMLTLLFATITAAITLQTFAPLLSRAIDRFVLARFPLVIEERAELRAQADSLPRHTPPTALDQSSAPLTSVEQQAEEEFVRLIRRALSQLDDLNKLATNPLIQLPSIAQHLAEHTATDSTLERAQALRALLIAAIAQLKPADAATFGTTNAWRYYNALYFPYVVGLKPYSRRTTQDGLATATQQALAWFRAQVPERTLYNWQNAAAYLVAQYVREVTAAKPTTD